MAISKDKTAECLGKLQLLKWFPPSGYALTELGRILNEICADDDEATAVVRLILEKHDEWPGPHSIRVAQSEVRSAKEAAGRERKHQADLAVWREDRNVHEATCPGYTISIREADKTLDVGECNKRWGNYPSGISCRKGESLPDAKEFRRRLQAEELAKRPGWETFGAKLERQFREQVARRKAEADGSKQ